MAKCSCCGGAGYHDCFMCYGTGKVTTGNICEAMRPEGRVTAYAPGDAHPRHLGDQYNQCLFWSRSRLCTGLHDVTDYVLRSGAADGLVTK